MVVAVCKGQRSTRLLAETIPVCRPALLFLSVLQGKTTSRHDIIMPLVDYGTVSIPMKNYVIFMCARKLTQCNTRSSRASMVWYCCETNTKHLQLAGVPRDPFAIGRNLILVNRVPEIAQCAISGTLCEKPIKSFHTGFFIAQGCHLTVPVRTFGTVPTFAHLRYK